MTGDDTENARKILHSYNISVKTQSTVLQSSKIIQSSTFVDEEITLPKLLDLGNWNFQSNILLKFHMCNCLTEVKYRFGPVLEMLFYINLLRTNLPFKPLDSKIPFKMLIDVMGPNAVRG